MSIPALICAFLATCSVQEDEVAKGIRSAAIPLQTVVAGSGFPDMVSLGTSLKGVDVVAMGECTHGSREVFQFKHRMFEYLVEEHGYTVFALESSMPDTVPMDRYVMYGEGTAEEAVQKQGFWTWSTQEVVDLLRWMRVYNKVPDHTKKVRVVGIDMQSQVGATVYFEHAIERLGAKEDFGTLWEDVSYERPSPEEMKRVEVTLAKYTPIIKEREGVEAAKLFERIGVVFHQAIENSASSEFVAIQSKVASYIVATLGGAEKLLEGTNDLGSDARAGLDVVVRSNKGEDFLKPNDAPRIKRYAVALRDYGKGLAEFEKSASVLDFFAYFLEHRESLTANWRDKCMADNLQWVRETYLPGQKVMLWAHNFHVGRTYNDDKPNMLGSHMAQRIGDKYLPVGFAFYEGSFQAVGQGGPLQEWTVPPAKDGSLDATLHRAGLPMFFLDLRRLNGAAKEWASKPQTTRNYGAVNNPAMADSYYGTIVPKDIYGAMVFISKTTRAVPIGPPK